MPPFEYTGNESNHLSRNEQFLRKIEETIESNLVNEQFGVENLAESMAMSRSQLFRRIHNLTGKSISQYIREVRLEKAMKLLKEDVASVSEISYQVGFSSPAYFNKCFHDLYGIPPGQVLKTHIAIQNESISKKETFETVQQPNRYENWMFFSIPVFVILIFIIGFLIFYKGRSFRHRIKEKSIAVLPFHNDSPDPENAYLCRGIEEELRNQLLSIEDLQVIGRQSVEKYTDPSDKKLAIIGSELNVSYLVSGSVREVEKDLRITVQLYDAKTGDILWGDTYDGKYDEELFSFQSNSALRITEAVKGIINPLEKEKIINPPTNYIAAYEFYLRGEDYYNRSDSEADFRFAIQMYEHATKIDPEFSLAWAGLASSSRNLYWYFYDRSEEQLHRTKQYLEKAIELDPDQAEVKLEEARYYYQCEGNYKKAVQILSELKSGYPGNPDIYFWMAVVKKRIGEFTEAIDLYNQAIQLDPYYWKYWRDIALVHQFVGNYNQAEECYQKVLELNPSLYSTYWNLVWLYYLKGDLDELKEFLNAAYVTQDSNIDFKIELELLNGNYSNAIELVESFPDHIMSKRAELYSKNWELGWLNYLNGNEKIASEYFEKERIFLEEKARNNKNDDRIYCSLGRIYAMLGNKSKSIEYGKKAIELKGLDNDAFGGIWNELEMANNLMMLGEDVEAISRYKYLLNYTKSISVELLKNSYQWKPFQDNKRFRKLISNPEYQVFLSDK